MRTGARGMQWELEDAGYDDTIDRVEGVLEVGGRVRGVLDRASRFSTTDSTDSEGADRRGRRRLGKPA